MIFNILLESLLFFYLCYFSTKFYIQLHQGNTMKLNQLYIALAISSLPLSSMAAGLDRSGQSISAFLQSGNYAELNFSAVDAKVKGKDQSGVTVNDMAESYHYSSAALKVQATDKISIGLIYDQPFGADSAYVAEDNSRFTTKRHTPTQGTTAKVDTHNITALIGYQLNENWNIYAGPVWQTVEADIKLRGNAYGDLNYNINVDTKEAYGWLAGFSYQIPEIALKAAVTYRSEIKHNAESVETSLHPLLPYISSDVQAITPQSVNIDLQTGIANNTLAFANLRWVHWDQFTVSPDMLKIFGQDLISYSDDQYSANVGVAHKFNDRWAVSTAVGYDSGAGNPVTTLGPTEGYWSLGAGAQYSPTDKYFISAGMKYLWLGDADAISRQAVQGRFTNNYALAYGLKMGYRF